MSRKFIFLLLTLFQSFTWAAEGAYTDRKIMFLSSYHPSYPWTKNMVQRAQEKLASTGVQLQIFYMDTKRRRLEPEKQEAAQRAKHIIDEFQPDVLIAADDDASKYVVEPYYKNTDLPVVFCGVNWDASSYGFTKKETEIGLVSNITGMIEQHIIAPLVKQLERYAAGKRIGYLSFDGISERKSFYYYQKMIGRSFDKYYFHTEYEDWKQSFLKLQDEVDMLVLYNPHGLTGWDEQDAIQFVEKNIKIPVGTTLYARMPFSVFGIVQLETEQAEWAVDAALRILDGEKPNDIPITHNKQGKLVINMRLVNKLGLKVDLQLLKTAEIMR